MNEIYERTLLLGSEHVDCHRRLRTSTLFELLQTASIRHTEELGMGRRMTLDRGLLWIIARQNVEIARMPVYDERITLRSWPGETMRVLFPRYYEIAAEDGTVLLRASMLWSLMEAQSRTVAFPDEYGVVIDGYKRGGELPYLVPLAPLEAGEHFDFTVPYSYVDLNGHMNNTRYFDMVEDRIPAAKEGRALRAVQTEYASEVRAGEVLHVAWGEEDGRYYVNGVGERPCFKMSLKYD